MTRVANSAVKVEKLLEVIRDIKRGKKGIKGEMFSFGLDEFDTGVIAEDVDVAIGVGGETTGERREMRESGGKGAFEKGNKIKKGIWRGREKNTFLNIVARKHRKIRNRELKRV